MEVFAYIKKVSPGKWRVFSQKGRNMGTFPSMDGAKKRLQQIEFFKHRFNRFRHKNAASIEYKKIIDYSKRLPCLTCNHSKDDHLKINLLPDFAGYCTQLMDSGYRDIPKRCLCNEYIPNLNKTASENNIDVTNTFSAKIRQLRKEDPEKVIPYLKAFKKAFDQAVEEGIDDLEQTALIQANYECESED